MTREMRERLGREFAGRRVLVVGGSGFLGRNLVHMLESLGADLTATGAAPAMGGGTRWLGRVDFCDLAAAQKAVAGQQMVVDCIGRLGAAASNLQPTVSLEHELRPQLNLMLACAEAGTPPTVLFTSSRLVYGAPRCLPVDEDHPLQPGSMYAVHKATAEQYLRLLARDAGMPFCIFRLANPYGPYQREDARSYGIVNAFFRSAARGQALTVYGEGRQERDYIYVDDVVEAMLRCAVEPRAHGGTFNLGTGRPMSLGEAAECIREAAGAPPVQYVPWPQQELAVETGDYFGSLERLRAAIGTFEPRGFPQGAVPTLEHYRALARTEQDGASVRFVAMERGA